MSNRKRLISNFLSLSGVQAAGYIFPLITVPYLVRVLGPGNFGLIAFAQAFVQYFVILTDYGFNLSATREISVNRQNQQRVSEIFCAVLLIKITFMVLTFLILCLLVFSISLFRAEWPLYLFSFGLVVGQVLFPVWFFQGIEKMKQIAALNIAAKSFFTVCIFIFIRSESDYIYVPLLNSLGFIVAGLISLWISIKTFGVRIAPPTFIAIKNSLTSGRHVFLASITATGYTTSIPFILGLFTNSTIVGYYSAGEKIVVSAVGMLGPLSQTLYPHIANIVSFSRSSGIAFIRRIAITIGVFTFGLFLLVFLLAPIITSVILGSQFGESILVLRILSILLFAKGLGNIFLLQTMLNFGHDKAVFKIVLLACIASLISCFVFIPLFLHIGAAMAAVIPELIVLFVSFFFVQMKYNILGIKSSKNEHSNIN